ncbi:hypothetical protein A9W97_02360 [Mycobacterium gordonae]|nr:DUF1490 family protein [Mycobacterium gordonae]OBJ81386.1 hypothetical protein A9W97_02360 [Mycobacterium gordonae]
MVPGFLVRSAVAGVVGAASYEAVRKAVSKVPVRKATVITTAWGIRVAREAERKAGQSAEAARLTVADVIAEAKERAGGEDVAPLTVANSGCGNRDN